MRAEIDKRIRKKWADVEMKENARDVARRSLDPPDVNDLGLDHSRCGVGVHERARPELRVSDHVRGAPAMR
jgi:hypothetical protein